MDGPDGEGRGHRERNSPEPDALRDTGIGVGRAAPRHIYTGIRQDLRSLGYHGVFTAVDGCIAEPFLIETAASALTGGRSGDARIGPGCDGRFVKRAWLRS